MKYFSLIVLCAVIRLTSSSQSMSDNKSIRIEGRTMGTSYSVVYFDNAKRDFSFSIDSVLQQVNLAISNYDSQSDVSTFNASVAGVEFHSIHFRDALQRSLEFAELSHGNFDPTVMPLVNLWGFGPGKKAIPSQVRIDSILKFVGYQKLTVSQNHILKNHPDVQIDFGGIGQGYGVDVVADFLRSKGVLNFLIELGGEGFASGKNLEKNSTWRIGIIDPFSAKDEPQLLGYALIDDEAFTTSGNYYNYHVINGKKYGHTISPFTGFPTEQELISVSLFAPRCTTADAWDTAFLVCGMEKTLEFLNTHQKLAAVLVYLKNGQREVFVTENIKDRIFLESPHDH